MGGSHVHVLGVRVCTPSFHDHRAHLPDLNTCKPPSTRPASPAVKDCFGSFFRQRFAGERYITTLSSCLVGYDGSSSRGCFPDSTV